MDEPVRPAGAVDVLYFLRAEPTVFGVKCFTGSKAGAVAAKQKRIGVWVILFKLRQVIPQLVDEVRSRCFIAGFVHVQFFDLHPFSNVRQLEVAFVKLACLFAEDSFSQLQVAVRAVCLRLVCHRIWVEVVTVYSLEI